MAYVSYQNGVLIDTIQLFYYTSFSTLNSSRLLLKENLFPVSLQYIAAFQLYPPDSIELEYTTCNEYYLPNNDTIRLWYGGDLSTIATPISTFSNVNIFGVQFIDQNSIRFRYPTDLYFVTGAGIVKMIQHKPSGDIPWTLVNYHISN